MMKYVMFFFVLIPLISMSFLKFFMQYCYLLLYLFFLCSGCFEYFNKISYSFGIDNFSFMLVLLSFLIGSLMIMSMIKTSKICFFLFINIFLSVFLLFIFIFLNFMYMYMCFEFVLVPLMILILGWGYQPERLVSGLYLFFYTLLVSLPLLILLVYIYMMNGTLFFDCLQEFQFDYFLIHFLLMLVFMVKLPLCFFHYWLPKAHVQAPVSGSMILAGLMLKIGGYGLIRVMYMYEYMYLNYSYLWFSLSMVGSLLISMFCMVQADMKCLIAYSSVAHMGMVIMGLLTMKSWGLWGSYFLMLAHGFCSSGLFYISNLYYIRTSSRSFFINSGLMMYLPSGSMMMFIMCSFNMSCPPSLNFMSEIMILSSMLDFWLYSSLFFLLSSFFCACFSYYLYSFSQHGYPHMLYSFSMFNILEFLCMFIHLIPIIFLPIVVFSLM